VADFKKFPLLFWAITHIIHMSCYTYNIILQESRAVAGNPRDAAVIFDP